MNTKVSTLISLFKCILVLFQIGHAKPVHYGIGNSTTIEVLATDKVQDAPWFSLANVNMMNAIIEVADYCAIAYCITSDNLKLGKLQNSCPLQFCTSTHYNIEVVHIFKGLISGVVLKNYDTKEIILAFKGTTSPEEWVVDTTYVPIKYVPYSVIAKRNTRQFECTGCAVHKGFYTSLSSFSQIDLPLIADLIEANYNYTVLVTGHSLGGALGVLGATELYLMGFDPKIVTLASPKVANSEFAYWMDNAFQVVHGFAKLKQSIMNSPEPNLYIRVTHKEDIIPLLPLKSMGFEHSGIEINIANSGLPVSLENMRVYLNSPQREEFLVWSLLPSKLSDMDVQNFLSSHSVSFAHQVYFFNVPQCQHFRSGRLKHISF